MDQIKIIERKYLEELRAPLFQGVAPAVERYKKPESMELDTRRLLPSPIVPSEAVPELLCANEGETAEEADNALRVFRWLGRLSPVQAADGRLWTTLTHTHFWGYTSRRWPGLKRNAERPGDYVIEHWFVRGGGKAGLRRNAISRLWWAAFLTVEPWESDGDLECFQTADPARFTKILLSNQQIWFDLLERNYGSNLRVRICLLDAMAEASESSVSITALSGVIAKDLNCIAKTRHLDGLRVSTLSGICKGLVSKHVDRLRAAGA